MACHLSRASVYASTRTPAAARTAVRDEIWIIRAMRTPAFQCTTLSRHCGQAAPSSRVSATQLIADISSLRAESSHDRWTFHFDFINTLSATFRVMNDEGNR
jgi:hypothetical protein